MSFWYFPVAERRKKKEKKNVAEIGNGLLLIEHEAGRRAGRGSRMGAGRAQAGTAGVRGRWAWRAGRRAWARGQAQVGCSSARAQRARGALGVGARGTRPGRGLGAWAGQDRALGALGLFLARFDSVFS